MSGVRRGLLAVLGLALMTAGGCAPPRGSQVVIGAKNFTEQVVLGELLAQEIEAISGRRVGRRFYLAGSYLCQQALLSGRIDAYVEYTGTALTAILKQPLPQRATADEVRERITQLYQQRFQIKVEPALGFEDTFALVMRTEDAARLHVHTIADLRGREDALKLGVGYEFQSRPDGLDGMARAYGLKFGPPRLMDLGLLYRAIRAGQVNLVAGNSTDGPIRALSLTVLADNLHYFPPYEAVPLVREDSLRLHPEIEQAMHKLAGAVTAEEMQRMNDAVDGQHRDVSVVVREFREGKGL